MNLATLVILTVLISTVSPCDQLYDLPQPLEVNEIDTKMLGTDIKSGCTCRERPGQFIVCFSRQTCHVFPKELNITTDFFILKATRVTCLRNGDLTNAYHLRKLGIEENYHLRMIESGTFRNFNRLTNLTISHNANLKILFKNTFEGLINLRELFLVKNGFKHLEALTPSLNIGVLPRLTKLDLSQNGFVSVKANDFSPMDGNVLQELIIVLCRIESVEASAFLPFRHLQILNLGGNNFPPENLTNVILKMNELQVPVQKLDLNCVGFRKGPSKSLMNAIAHSNISILSLAYNQFEVIKAQTFPAMPNVELLDLRNAWISNITSDAFIGFPKLGTLLLGGNRLPSIPKSLLLQNVTFLDLDSNSGPPSQPYFSVYGHEKFAEMAKLERLSLSFNNLQAIYSNCFKGLVSLKSLYLKNATIYRIYKDGFGGLDRLEYLNLENNYFVVSSPGLESTTFKGLSRLKVLILSGCNIHSISTSPNPFEFIPNLQYLDLANNKLIEINGLQLVTNLKTLILSNNDIQPWYRHVFYIGANLSEINLDSNKITFITDVMIHDFQNLSSLILRNNPFTCECSDINWRAERIFKLMENQTTFCTFPEKTTNFTLQQYTHLSRYTCKHSTLYTIIISVVLGVLFLILIAFLIYHYRWHIEYWFFLTKIHLIRKARIRMYPKNCYDNYHYDAFVSYSNEDSIFVEKLVETLEKNPPFLKLCNYERDFKIGTPISENVLECVSKSRRTLLVVSDHYAKSQWCRWESQFVEYHRIFVQKNQQLDDGLIIIKLSHVQTNDLPPTLNFIMKTHIYLEWNEDGKKQCAFWDKLRSVLVSK